MMETPSFRGRSRRDPADSGDVGGRGVGPGATRANRARGAESADEGALALLRLLTLVALAGGAVYLVGRMLWPLLPAIALSTVVAVLVYPLYRPMRRRLRSPAVAAALGTAGVFFLLIVPTAALSVVVGHQIVEGIGWVRAGTAGVFRPEGALTRWLEQAATYLGLDPAGAWSAVGAQLQRLAGVLANRTLGFLSGLAGWLLQAGAAIFTLYYLLRDGDVLVARIRWLIPLERSASERLIRRAHEVTYATVYGSVGVALAQGALGGLAFAALGVPGAALWGAVMALLSLLPVIGAPVVWIPAGILLLLAGDIGKGIALLAFGTLVISTIDNLLRSLLVGGRAQLHPLIVFLSVLGGLFVFGAAGILVGPVVFVVALTVIDLARTALEPPPSATSSAWASPSAPASPSSAGAQAEPASAGPEV